MIDRGSFNNEPTELLMGALVKEQKFTVCGCGGKKLNLKTGITSQNWELTV